MSEKRAKTKAKPLKIPANSVSLAGEFAVLSQLALRGYDANMTLGHTKSVDILVSDPKRDKMYKLEVKTNLRDLKKRPAESKYFGKTVSDWIMHAKHERIYEDTLFYCFVTIGKSGHAFRFFIVPSRIVANYVKREHQYWLKHTIRGKGGDMRLFRIGLRGEKYRFPTPVVEDYENNWKFNR